MAPELPLVWTILGNVAAWLCIHLGVSYTSSRLPLGLFREEGWLYRARRWERGGRVYQAVFRIRAWKGLLPDGAALFKKGFRKRRIASRSTDYLHRFILETCRAELCHWLAFALVPLFFLWNPWYVAVLMIPYAVATNAPCILTQRFNRPRLRAELARSLPATDCIEHP
jgi:glycosyl-4,4'-diaponeurosporenoate acyltransferase